jgi:hypothetical protein
VKKTPERCTRSKASLEMGLVLRRRTVLLPRRCDVRTVERSHRGFRWAAALMTLVSYLGARGKLASSKLAAGQSSLSRTALGRAAKVGITGGREALMQTALRSSMRESPELAVLFVGYWPGCDGIAAVLRCVGSAVTRKTWPPCLLPPPGHRGICWQRKTDAKQYSSASGAALDLLPQDRMHRPCARLGRLLIAIAWCGGLRSACCM